MGEDAANGADGARERELAEQGNALERRARDLAESGERGDGDGQIEGRAGLAQVGRREVHGDAVLGHEDAELPERRADAHAALADGAVGQADHLEPAWSARARHLDPHGSSVEAEERSRVGGREHDRT